MSSIAPTLQEAPSAVLSPWTPPDAATAAEARLDHLFRTTLATGHIHPLYLPMLKFRLAQDGS